jgi:hypothetical protein
MRIVLKLCLRIVAHCQDGYGRDPKHVEFINCVSESCSSTLLCAKGYSNFIKDY